MSKIKIAFVIDQIDYKIGGTERQLLLLLDHINKNEFDPWLCVFRSTDWIKENRTKYNIYYFDFGSFFSPKSYFSLYKFSRFLKNNKFRIVQTQFRDGNIVGILAAKLAGIKTILAARRNEGYWLNKTEILILKFLNRWVKGFIVNSESVKKFVQKVEGADPSKINVIYNGVDFSKFENAQKSARDLRKTIGLKDNDFVVVSVANLRPVKRIDLLIEAATEVVSKNRAVKFLLVGDGEEEGKLKELVRQNRLDENIIFLGKRSDIPQILSLCSAGVLTSDSEGLSNAIIEYMGAGLPVICTKVGGNEELVEEGVNGFLIQRGDAGMLSKRILRLAEDPSLAAKMGQISRRKAQELFGLDVLLKKTEDYYKTMLVTNSDQ